MLDGKQSSGFEELVCQVANLEDRTLGSEFFRKGKGRDAGLECFVRQLDGVEHGWQVKYSWAFDTNLRRSLNASIDAALKKHPKLEIVTICLPFDLSDARGHKETPLQALEKWREERLQKAKADDRIFDIDFWGAFEIGDRLVSDDPRRSGRILYWFGTQHLTTDWFAKQFKRVRASLGPRYTAETNVKLPIRRSLLGLSRNPEVLRELVVFRRKLREESESVSGSFNLSDEQSAGINRAASSLDAIEDLGAEPWPVGRWSEDTKTALEIVRALYHTHFQAKHEANKHGTKPPDSRQGSALRRALEIYNDLLELLSEPVWSLAKGETVLVTGEAGSGKSHLLADVCAHQLEKKRPALLFMGSTLKEDEIWPQLLKQLDLPSAYTRDAFLGALDAAGEAAGTRALLMIDAINERHGPRIWPERLGSFLDDAEQFPHVAIVLSCRSTYLPHVVPDNIDEEKLPRVEHSGFSINDARAYLKLRGILLPDHPFLNAEMRNPLFLKICCDALERDGINRFPKGIRGVSAVFRMFSAAVCGTLERRLNLNSRRNIPGRAIDALAQEMQQTRDPYIPYARAAKIVDAIHTGGSGQEDDLLFQLETEGVLTAEPIPVGDELIDHIRFTFERYADHVVAAAILEDALIDEKLPNPLSANSALANAFKRGGAVWGVREALSIQVPERFGIELPDVLAQFPEARTEGIISPETVRIRLPTSITMRTLELLQAQHGSDSVWDAIIRFSIEIDGVFNAQWLHKKLILQSMPERDSNWSIYLANNADEVEYRHLVALRDLIEWGRGILPDEVDPDIITQAAITITWCLTTSNRRVRDTSTMALVCILTAMPGVAVKLLELFEGVNDPYVGERIAAAIYGAALQGNWNDDQLTSVANEIIERFFTKDALPIDLVWRDHLSSLLLYAESRSCQATVPIGMKTQAPFTSPWPLEPVTDEQINGYTRTYGKGYVSTDEIVSSTGDHGDFGRYIIGYAVDDWSPAAQNTFPLPTTEDLFYNWKAEFDAYSTPRMINAFDAMNAIRGKDNTWMHASGKQAEKHKKLEQEFKLSIGAERFERYRVLARYWRPGSGWWAASNNPAEFDVPWARRWVCKRAHDLGWSEEIHGSYDQACGSGRMEHKQERIGKKYQWIALRELMARVSDNCAAANIDWHAQYRETVRRLRDIDPSLLMEASHDWGWASFDDTTFWMPHVLKPTATTLPEAWEWLDGQRDILDGLAFIDLEPDGNGEEWLPLSGFQHFRHYGTTRETESISRETWLRLDCFVVHKLDESVALNHLKDTLFLGSHDLGFNYDGVTEYFFGEHGWRNHVELGWTKWWGSRGNSQAPVEARATTCQFLQEAGGYDHSLYQNISVWLPAPWLIESMQLRLVDGRNARYVNEVGSSIFFDPSIDIEGASAGLVERNAFFDMCKQEDLMPIWVLGGAKEVHVKDRSVYGRYNFTSIYTAKDNTIKRRSHQVELESRRKEK